MKTKYERMNKVEKRKVYLSYKEEKKELVKKMNRMFILCYIGTFYGFISFFYDLFLMKSKVNYILDIIIFLFCLICILKLNKTKKELLNKYVLDNKKRF